MKTASVSTLFNKDNTKHMACLKKRGFNIYQRRSKPYFVYHFHAVAVTIINSHKRL